MSFYGLTEHASAVVKTVDCPRCDSEAGYMCTYVVPNHNHRATTAARKALLDRVGSLTKQPHSERFEAFRRWEQAEARKRYQAVIRSQREAKEAALRRAWYKRNELRLAYAEFGKREALELGEWLRKNHMIFRIDETFTT